MRHSFLFLAAACLSASTASTAAGQPSIAIVGLLHSHVWGHFDKMVKGEPAKLVGIAETEPELVAEAKKRGASASLIFSDYKKMLDQTKPTMVWAFVENNRHLEIIEACAPRKINVIFEKPLASTHKDAVAMAKLARQHGIHVLTNYQMAWWPTNYAAKAQADAGAIGKVYRLRGVVGHGGPGSSGVGKFFFAWLTDPVKNGAGALMDFGCYNALWSLWYLGRPDTVYASVNHLRPEVFPKVEDNSSMILNYKNGQGIFEGSWDLPRSFHDLEVFGNSGSMYITRDKVEVRKSGRGRAGGPASEAPSEPLPPERAEPIARMIHAIETGKSPDGLVALDINVQVVEIIDAAKMSVASGKAVKLN